MKPKFPSLAGDPRALASARKGRAATVARYLIEGQHVTMPEIAARLGVSVAAAYGRMKKLRGQPGAITWERLGAAAGGA